MKLGLEDKTALVLGAGGGLGSAIALALGREGARVAIADVDRDALARTADVLETMKVKTYAVTWDISDLPVVQTNVTAIEKALGSIDVLVNITGGPPPTPAAAQDSSLWSSGFDQMILPVIKVTDCVLPAMRARNWGRIITSTSSGVISPIPNLGISNALRLALVGWSKTLAREVARDGITANVIVPGRIATARIHALDKAKAAREGRTVEDVAAESTTSIPIGRYGNPEEYADVVTFLASERSAYITGSIVRVDGGLIASI